LIWEDYQYFAYSNDDIDDNNKGDVYMKYEAVVNSSTTMDIKNDIKSTTAASPTSNVTRMMINNTNTSNVWRSSVSYKENKYISQDYYPTRHAARQATSELMMRCLDDDHYRNYLKLKTSVKTVLKQMRRDASQELKDRSNEMIADGDDDSDHHNDDTRCIDDDDFDGRYIAVDDNDDDDDADYEDDKDEHEAFTQQLSGIIEDGYRDINIDIDIEYNLTLSSQVYKEDDNSTSDDDNINIDEEDDDDDVTNNGDEDGDDSFPEVNELVNDDEYLSYLKDSDIEHYLNGLLWVAQMYVDGACPDVSYRYNGRPPITAYSIKMYIERIVGPLMNISESSQPQPLSTIVSTILSTSDEAKQKLAHRIKVPQSDLRYFDSYNQLIIACFILYLILMMLVMIVMMMAMMVMMKMVVMVIGDAVLDDDGDDDDCDDV
jgi:hypothetical protein